MSVGDIIGLIVVIVLFVLMALEGLAKWAARDFNRGLDVRKTPVGRGQIHITEYVVKPGWWRASDGKL